jgi:predicted alpha/beta-fold hydrolase
VWETLATTRRQDRVLHGLAKVAQVPAGALLSPIWLIGQRLGTPLRGLLARQPSAGPPLPVPPARERSMDALMAELRAMPHTLGPSRTAELRKGLLDWAPFVLAQQAQGATFGYSYPSQFRNDYYEGADGERISVTVALHQRPRPGLVVVHGLFSNRLFDYVREIAVRAYYEWGFNVAAVDLRSFGLTDLTSRAPSTAGWKEGEDLICAGRYLKQLGSTSVGAVGISLGASSVLGASHPEGAEEALDGGILAICGPGDTHRAAERLSRRVPLRHPAYPINRFFQAMLKSRVRSGRWPDHITTLTEPIEVIAAPYYGVTGEEIWERSSARNHIHKARVPVLVLHSVDDMIIPVEHARMLEEAGEGNDNVSVWIVPGGQHAAFDVLDRRWTYSVYRRFFERWARYAERDELAADGGGAEVVYSPAPAGKVEAAGTR